MSAQHVPYISRDEILALLPVDSCIAAMEQTFTALANGQVVQPLRTAIHLPDGSGSLYTMPAFTADPPALAVKMITIFPGNRALGRESHEGVVLLFDTQTGELRAMLDAGALTAVRTAAVTALATRLLARPDAGDLAMLGTGVQAAAHLDALLCVRTLRRIRVWSPARENVLRFVKQHSSRLGLEIEAAASARDAVTGADIVCTVTSSHTPVLEGDWLTAGAHVNAVGASMPTTREVDTETIRRARVFVDMRAAALAEAGDVLIPINEGVIGADHVLGELADLVLSRVTGRLTDHDITFFKSLGLAMEDAAAAAIVLRNTESRG
jgi:ornithine cyclodeaminase